MNAADVPLTLTGTWATDAPKLQAVGDAALRAALATSSGASMVGFRSRTVADRLNDTANVKDYGAIGDGDHRLSERYATLAAAQAEYPFVTSLTQSIDWAACQSALNAGGVVDFSGRKRNYSLSQTLVVSVEGTTLKLSGCAFTAASGFTGDMMLSIPANGVLYFNRCDRYSLGDMGATNFKWKGLYNANGADFSVKTAFCTDGVADEAAIFFASCAGFQVDEMQVRRAFGVKFDRCTDFQGSGFHINCAGIGQIGLMVQGCISYNLEKIFIRGFTIAGIEASYHPGPPAANILVGNISNFEIRNGAAGSLCGVRMFGSATESAGQLQLSSGYIYACARGVQLRNVGTGVLNRQLSIKDLTIDTFEVAGIEGVSREMAIKNVEFYNAGASAVGCIDLWHDAGQTCESLSVVGCSAPGLPSAVSFIRAVSTATRMLKVGTLHIAANSAKGGARFLDLALTQASDYLRVLNISANTHDGSASATSVGLSNAGPSLVPQVCITGNNLLTSAYAKANITFAETAASAKWNGVVENNMAGVTNKPNNV